MTVNCGNEFQATDPTQTDEAPERYTTIQYCSSCDGSYCTQRVCPSSVCHTSDAGMQSRSRPIKFYHNTSNLLQTSHHRCTGQMTSCSQLRCVHNSQGPTDQTGKTSLNSQRYINQQTLSLFVIIKLHSHFRH